MYRENKIQSAAQFIRHPRDPRFGIGFLFFAGCQRPEPPIRKKKSPLSSPGPRGRHGSDRPFHADLMERDLGKPVVVSISRAEED